MSMTTSSVTSNVTTQSVLVQNCLQDICLNELKRVLPPGDSDVAGIWTEDSILTITAVFELQRVALHSEVQEQSLHNNIIARAIHDLATRVRFADHTSPSVLRDLETHLRILASAITTYKYTGTSLDHKLRQEVYDGITRLSNVFDKCRTGTTVDPV